MCVNDFTFFAITKQSGLKGADGILGLAPYDKENGPSFVEALKKANIIDKMQASFFLSHKKPSSISFGNYN